MCMCVWACMRGCEGMCQCACIYGCIVIECGVWMHSLHFESTRIDSRRAPSNNVDGCLAGRRPLFGRQKKKPCHRLARQNGEAAKTSRIDPLRFLVYTRWSLQHSNQSTMWKLQGHVGTAIQALGFRLDRAAHPDLGAARLGLDLPGPARILVLDCLYPTLQKPPHIHRREGAWVCGVEEVVSWRTDPSSFTPTADTDVRQHQRQQTWTK